MNSNNICCDEFLKLIPALKWLSTKNGIYLMPYFQYEKKKLRINYCPCCGNKIRDIQFDIPTITSYINREFIDGEALTALNDAIEKAGKKNTELKNRQ